VARSGFQAQATAVAVPEAQLQRFSLSLEPGLSTRQMHAAIAAQLAKLLQHPVHETVWDFELQTDQPAASSAPSAQPAWLQAALQAQATQTADVLVITRAWVSTCEQWCRAAGLQLVRLEPPWQASSRWQVFAQNHEDRVSDLVAQALTTQQQAVLGGLALGVVMP
jgi:Tfp pilus assembly PilM family ATPase